MRKNELVPVLAVTMALALAACSRSPAEPAPGPGAPAAASGAGPHAPASMAAPSAPPLASPLASGSAKLALTWDDPPRWKRHPPASAMRAAEYLVPRAPSDTEDAECTVITFGAGQGGSVDENVDRWVKQLDHASPPSRSVRKVHGMNVTRVDVTGTFNGMRMPGGPASAPHPGWRLSGAIVEAPSGAWFFKLTGPDATVKAAAKELDDLVDSCRP